MAAQLEPTNSMKMENPLTRVESPAAVRPPDWTDPRGSIGGDVRTAMEIMLGMDEKDAEKALEEKRKAAETNKGELQTPKLADEFGNNS
jgi:hypothetical protein